MFYPLTTRLDALSHRQQPGEHASRCILSHRHIGQHIKMHYLIDNYRENTPPDALYLIGNKQDSTLRCIISSTKLPDDALRQQLS